MEKFLTHYLLLFNYRGNYFRGNSLIKRLLKVFGVSSIHLGEIFELLYELARVHYTKPITSRYLCEITQDGNPVLRAVLKTESPN